MRSATLILAAGARAMSLKAGAQVPKFAVTAHTGAAVSSDSLAGSAYCLWFYPKADTGGATRRRLAVPSNRPRCIAALTAVARRAQAEPQRGRRSRRSATSTRPRATTSTA